jgi:hypothetical protein
VLTSDSPGINYEAKPNCLRESDNIFLFPLVSLQPLTFVCYCFQVSRRVDERCLMACKQGHISCIPSFIGHD